MPQSAVPHGAQGGACPAAWTHTEPPASCVPSRACFLPRAAWLRQLQTRGGALRPGAGPLLPSGSTASGAETHHLSSEPGSATF